MAVWEIFFLFILLVGLSVALTVFKELAEHRRIRSLKYCEQCGKELIIFTEPVRTLGYDPISGERTLIEFKGCPETKDVLFSIHTKIKIGSRKETRDL